MLLVNIQIFWYTFWRNFYMYESTMDNNYRDVYGNIQMGVHLQRIIYEWHSSPRLFGANLGKPVYLFTSSDTSTAIHLITARYWNVSISISSVKLLLLKLFYATLVRLFDMKRYNNTSNYLCFVSNYESASSLYKRFLKDG